MSEATHAVLEEAIRNHIADQIPGGLVTAFFIGVSVKTEDDFESGTTRYPYMTQIGQEYHTTLGLIHKFRKALEDE